MCENGEPRQYTEAEKLEEERRIRRLRTMVDLSMALIAQSPITLDEAERLVDAVRRQAILLFPGKEELFEIIYTPRFRRLIADKFGFH